MPQLARVLFPCDAPVGSVGQSLGVISDGTIGWQSLAGISITDFGADPTGLTDSTAAIQAALNTGLNIYKPPGTYLVSQITFAANGQVMWGPGNIQQIAGFVAHCVTIPSSLSDCLFTGGKIIGNNYLAGNFAINIKGVRNGISQCTVTNTSSHGIVINGAHTDSPQTSHCYVRDCEVYATGTQARGILVNGDDAGGGPIHCSITSCHTSNTGEAGVSYTGCTHLLIANNVIENAGFGTTEDGITGYDAFSSDITITGNVIYNTNNHGIHVGGNRLVISNNEINTVVNSGILVQQAPNSAPVAGVAASITGNTIYNVEQGVGISVGNYSQVTIAGNVIDTVTLTHGIQVNDAAQGSSPTGLSITGNQVSRVATGQGIRVQAFNDFSIVGNTINSIAQNGIKVTAVTTDVNFANGIISGNNITNCGASFNAISVTATAPAVISNVIVGPNNCDSASLPLVAFAGNVSTSLSASAPGQKNSPTFGATVTPDNTQGAWQTVTATSNIAVTMAAPPYPPSSTATAEMTVEVLNSSGGAMGAITWNAAFVFAGLTWTNPANTKRRYARFEWNGANWICTGIASADY